MTPIKRAGSRRNWPDHLHCRDGYYSWRDPRPGGKEYGLGRNKVEAFAQAIEANLHLAAARTRPALVDRLTGAAERALGAWWARYETILEGRELAANTRRAVKSLLGRARRTFPAEIAVSAVTPLMVADAVRELELEGKRRMAQAFRSFLTDAFREAIAAGWLEQNPARAVRVAQVKVKRARLTLEVLEQIRAAEQPDWLRIAVDLAVVSAQRREDVAAARFADFRPDWHVRQQKTGAMLVLPLDLRLDVLGLSLGDVLARARRTGAVSRYLVHQTQPFGNSPTGSRIFVDTVTRRFSDVVAGLGIDWGDQTPPTFHELRSLAERLYSRQGNVSTQALLGHRDPRMTATYADPRGAEWVRVEVGKGRNAGGMREPRR